MTSTFKARSRAVACGVAAAAVYCAGAHAQGMLDKLQPAALKVAQLQGSGELGCPAAAPRLLKREVVEEGAMSGWSDVPRRADYIVAVSGCGKQQTYRVSCDRWKKDCSASVAQKSSEAKPRRFADELQPAAMQTAQHRGATELDCPGASAAVLRKETVEEGQTTGWYDPPHRALFRIDVTGCGKSRPYLVSCDSRAKGDGACAAVAFQQSSKRQVSPLANELRPTALAAAQRRAASELACPAAEAAVLREEAIEEPQTTGWYQPPHRALYKMDATGCGRRATYVVACDRQVKLEKACTVGTLGSPP